MSTPSPRSRGRSRACCLDPSAVWPDHGLDKRTYAQISKMTRKCDPITARERKCEPDGSQTDDNDPKLEDRRARPISTNEYYHQTDIKVRTKKQGRSFTQKIRRKLDDRRRTLEHPFKWRFLRKTPDFTLYLLFNRFLFAKAVFCE